MDDHSWMAQKRVQAAPIWLINQARIGRLKHTQFDLPIGKLPDALEWVFKENDQKQEKGQGDHRYQDHPGQKFAVAMPFA